MMWQSPINIYTVADEMAEQFNKDTSEYIMKVVRRVAVDVDEKELLSALRYDRNQYEKGYKDGYREAIEKVRAKLKEVDVEFNYLDSLISQI